MSNLSSQSWPLTRFGDVVRNVNDNVRDPLSSDLERYVGLDHLDPESLHIKRWGLIADGTTFTRKFVAGQVLFGKRRAYQRKAAVAEFDGICSGDILVFEPANDQLLPELLPFIVQSDGFFQHALGTSAGSLSPRTKWQDLARYEFALPPLDEQRRIAEILWAADEACRKQADLLTDLSAFRQAFIDHVLPDPELAHRVNFVSKLQDVCEMQNGHSYPSEEYGKEGVRLLAHGNLGKDGYLQWSPNATKSLPDRYLQLTPNHVVDKGDVVICLTAQSLEDAFMGRVCLAREGDFSLLNQRIGRFICNERIIPEYLFRCLQATRFSRWAELRCEGSKIKNLYWRHIADFTLPCPSIENQEQIIRQLASIDAIVDATREHFETTSSLRRTLGEWLFSPNNL
jgi:type I restriction enzyme S subunit